MDETRWRQRGQPKTGGRWGVVTKVTPRFQVGLRRSQAGAQDLRGARSAGGVGSDRAGSDAWLAVEQRPVCWRHVRRDLQRLLERGGASCPMGTNLKRQGEYLLTLWARSRDAPSPPVAFRAERPQIQRLVHDWLSQGVACSDSQTAKTGANLLALEPALWTFASQPGVEPTNNAAERAVRHPVIWRPLAYGTHSAHDRPFVERILTPVAACRQQHRACLALVRQAVIAHPSGQPVPSLLPDPCDVTP
jgi:transposase